MFLKHILFYYAAIVTPLLTIILLSISSNISTQAFSVAILIYALVYHPGISAMRLIALGVIKRREAVKSFIPFWNMKYMNFLYKCIKTPQRKP
jgi:hypothetical protein